MCYYICITKGKNFKPASKKIISLKQLVDGESGIDYGDNIVTMFDDRFGNFIDLEYFDPQYDLTKKSVPKVFETVKKILEKLENDGYKARTLTREDEMSRTIPIWAFGHVDKKDPNAKITKEEREDFYPIALPKDERISILMYHLYNLLEYSLEYNTSEYYYYLDCGVIYDWMKEYKKKRYKNRRRMKKYKKKLKNIKKHDRKKRNKRRHY